MYDPTVGEFINEDPIGFEAGDANLMRYVGNGPTMAADPSGLAERPLRIIDAQSVAEYQDFFGLKESETDAWLATQGYYREREERGLDQVNPMHPLWKVVEVNALKCHVEVSWAANVAEHRADAELAKMPPQESPKGQWSPSRFFGFNTELRDHTRYGCGGLAAWRAGAPLVKSGAPHEPDLYHPRTIPELKGARVYGSFPDALAALQREPKGGLIVAFQHTEQWPFYDKNRKQLDVMKIGAGGLPALDVTGYLASEERNVASFLGTSSQPYWEDANVGWDSYSATPTIYHRKTDFSTAPLRWKPKNGFTVYVVVL